MPRGVQQKAQRWCFTVQRGNDPCLLPFSSDDCVAGLLGWKMSYRLPDNVAMIACQFERAARLHVQGYVEFVRAVSMEAVKGNVDLWGVTAGSGVHLEIAEGSRADNIKYVTKLETRVPETVPFELKDEARMAQVRDARQKRSRQELADRAEEQMKWIDMTEELMRRAARENVTVEHFPFWVRRMAGDEPNEDTKVVMMKVAATVLRSTRMYADILADFTAREMRRTLAENPTLAVRDVEVHYWYGAPGTGKTHEALMTFNQMGVYKVVRGMPYFDGYNPFAHAVLLLDDFSGKEEKFLTPSMLQDLLQGVPLRLNVKGKSPVVANYYVVVITSNLKFDELYSFWAGIHPIIKDSIRSRITYMREFVGQDKRVALRTTHVPYRPVRTTVVKERYTGAGVEGEADAAAAR